MVGITAPSLRAFDTSAALETLVKSSRAVQLSCSLRCIQTNEKHLRILWAVIFVSKRAVGFLTHFKCIINI